MAAHDWARVLTHDLALGLAHDEAHDEAHNEAHGRFTREVVPLPPWTLVAGAVVIAIAVPLLGYPASKTTWSAIDLAMHPLDPVEQAEAIAHADNPR